MDGGIGGLGLHPTYDPAAVVAPHDVTPEWLTALLRSRGLLADGEVRAVSRSAFGTGQMARSLRFLLDYSAGGSGPTSSIGNFPSADPASREFGVSRGLYENEVRFYTEIAPTVPIAVPTALHSAIAPDGLFTLLLEDLAPALVVDQLSGSTVDQMTTAVEQPWLRNVAKGFTAVVHQLTELTTVFRACRVSLPRSSTAWRPRSGIQIEHKIKTFLRRRALAFDAGRR